MLITIPTYGRANRQLTLRKFPQAILVVRPEEQHLYPERKWVLDDNLEDKLGISATRDWIIARAFPEPVLMLDDDLKFDVRREDDPTKFREAYGVDYLEMTEALVDLSKSYPHVSMSSRQGANRNTESVLYNGRCMRVHLFSTLVLVHHRIVGYHPDAPFMRDFYITLRLLTLGYTNAIVNDYVNDHPGSNVVPGGCTGQRTLELLKRSAEVLQSEFPDFVKIELKNTKGSWNGESRYDVRIAWKKAYAAGANSKAMVLDVREGSGEVSEGAGGE
jgi:hypothetical protein